MTFDNKRFNKLSALAVHPTTNQHVANSAALKALQMLDKATADNMTVTITWTLDGTREFISAHTKKCYDDAIDKANRQYAQEKVCHDKEIQKSTALAAQIGILNERIRALTDDLASLQEDYARLDKENSQLSACNAHSDAKASFDTKQTYCSFAEFEQKAKNAIGRQYTKSLLAFELNISLKILTAWQTVGIVPPDFTSKIDDFSENQLEPASREHWSYDEVNELKAILIEGASDFLAARMLTTRFGRRRFESNVARKRRQLFIDYGWKPKSKDRSSSVWSRDDIAPLDALADPRL